MTTIEINKRHYKNFVIFEDGLEEFELLKRIYPRKTIKLYFYGRLQKTAEPKVKSTQPLSLRQKLLIGQGSVGTVPAH